MKFSQIEDARRLSDKLVEMRGASRVCGAINSDLRLSIEGASGFEYLKTKVELYGSDAVRRVLSAIAAEVGADMAGIEERLTRLGVDMTE